MQIQFQNTKEDFVEGHADLATWSRQRARRSSVGLFFAAASVLFTTGWFTAWQHSPFSDVRWFWMNLSLPYSVFVIFIFSLVVRAYFRARKWKQLARLAVVNLVSILLLLALPMALNSMPFRSIAPTPSISGLQLLLTHAPWIFLFSIFAILSIRGQTTRSDKLWQGQPSLMRAKLADISAEGVILSDPFSRVEFKWPAFVRFSETKNLFLLYNSDFSFLMIPKRAFPDQEHLEAMRALARTITPAPAAFPVQPVDC
jgi:hypothetical protein